jgi:Cyclin, N-terminal domain
MEDYQFIASAITMLWLRQRKTSPQLATYIRSVLSHAPSLPQSALYITLLYISNLSASTRRMQKCQMSEYKVFVAALVLADISVNDHTFSINAWSEITGFTRREVVAMRDAMLGTLGYNLTRAPEVYAAWVVRIHALMEGR